MVHVWAQQYQQRTENPAKQSETLAKPTPARTSTYKGDGPVLCVRCAFLNKRALLAYPRCSVKATYDMARWEDRKNKTPTPVSTSFPIIKSVCFLNVGSAADKTE